MTKQRRSFTPEFKREAADLVLKQNYSYIEASRLLGIGESALRRRTPDVERLRLRSRVSELFSQSSSAAGRRSTAYIR